MFWLLIALLCKPTAMVTPMLAAVLDYFILRRPLRKIARSILPWVLLVVPFAVVAKLVQPGSGIMSPPLWERPIVAGASLAFYLGKLLVPSNFTFGYDWVPLTMLQKNWFWAIAAVPLVLGALLWIYRWPKWLVAACAISVAALLPVLGFVPFLFQFYSTVADHYVYLAMLGPAMALAWGVAQVPARRWREAAVLCVTVALVLSGLTLWHLRFWHDEPALLYHILAVRPGSLLAHNGLGKFYQGHRNYVRAEEEYRKTVALNPEYLSARENLVNIYSYLGRADEAIEQIHALMAIHAKLPERYREDYTGAFFEVGQLTLSQGRYADAVRYLTESVRLRPEHAESRRLLQLAKEKFQAAATQAATKDAK
jgi:Flp pilus assembly protein TadD